MNRLCKSILLVAFFSVLLLIGTKTILAEEKNLDKVLIGSSPTLSSAGFFIAKEKGYFQEQGIDAEIKIFKGSSAEIVPLLATGKLDVGAGALNSGLYNAINEGIAIKVVADKGHSPRGTKSVLISKKLYTGKLDKETIKGKKFASKKGFPHEMFLELFLKEYGLTLNDIEVVPLSYPNINVALANGSLFGAAQLEPFLSKALANGSAVEVMDCSDIYPKQQGGVIFYSDNFTSKRRNVAVKVMAAYIKALRYFNDYLAGKVDKDEFEKILNKFTAIENFGFLKRVQPPQMFDPNGYLNMESIKRDLGWYAQKGYIKEIPPLSKIVDNSFVEEALKIIGRR